MPQPNQKIEVCLDEAARQELEVLSRSKIAAAAQVRNARVLLLADEDRRLGRRPDWYIAEVIGISERQIVRIRQRFVREGLRPTLERKKRTTPGTAPKFDGQAEARLVALCCSTPPAGQQRWTLQLLVDELCRLRVVAHVCRETVRRCLKKVASSRGRRSGSASPKRTVPASSRTSKKSSTSTAKRSTRPIR